MKRCIRNITLALPAAVLMTLAGLPATPVSAQSDGALSIRQFPKAAVRGQLVMRAPPDINMNGKADRLSPGARIRNGNNNYVLSSALLGQELRVNYTRDSAGLVHEVWILNAEEAKEDRAGLSTRNFSFGFESSTAPQDDGKTPYNQLPGYRQ